MFRSKSIWSLVVVTAISGVAIAQDSVPTVADCPANSEISDALTPWDTTETCNNYVVDMSEFFSSWGTSFGIAPIAKASQSDPAFATSFVNAHTISRQQLQGVSYFSTSYDLWTAAGEGVNSAANASPSSNIDASAFVGNQFAAAFNEGAGTADGANFDGVVGVVVNYDPAVPNRLYVSRVNAATNSCDSTTNYGGIAMGTIDASGNIHARVDAGFDVDLFADCTGQPNLTPFVGGNTNAFRIDLRSRACNDFNVITNDFTDPPANSLFDLGATDWVLRDSSVTHPVPGILPEHIRGAAPLYIGSNFNGEYSYEDPTELVTEDGVIDSSAHTVINQFGNTIGTRGNIAYVGQNCACLNSTHGLAANYGKDEFSETSVINIWGLAADGSVTGAMHLRLPQGTIADPTTTFAATDVGGLGINEFAHGASQTPFAGGNGNVAINVLADGSIMVAAAVTAPSPNFTIDCPGGSQNLNAVNYIAVARVSCDAGMCPASTCTTGGAACDPNDPNQCSNNVDGTCDTAADWSIAAYSRPATFTCDFDGVACDSDSPCAERCTITDALCDSNDPNTCNSGADGGCFTDFCNIDTVAESGKPILDGPAMMGGVSFGQLRPPFGGNCEFPAITVPAIDAGGNIWFVGTWRFDDSDSTEFGLFRAVYNPVDFAPFGHELELVMSTDDFNFPFTGRNSTRNYIVDRVEIADANSISSSAMFSLNISEQAYLGGSAAGLAPADPENLGGFVLGATIRYDVDDDGDFTDCADADGGRCSGSGAFCTFPGGANSCNMGADGTCIQDSAANNVDQTYRALMYISPFTPEGPPDVPCSRDCDCHTTAVAQALVDGVDANTLLDICDYSYCDIPTGEAMGVCASCTRRYGNTCSSFQAFVSTDDISCAVTGFGNYCACPNGDLIGAAGAKGPNGIPIGTDDILAIVAAFGGANPFTCATPAAATCETGNQPTPGGCGPASASSIVAGSAFTGNFTDNFTTGDQPEFRRVANASSNASFTMVPRQRAVRAGGLVEVDVFVSGVEGLIGFELGVATSGGRRGEFALEGVEIDTQRRDYVFVGLSNFPATDATLGRVGGAVLAGSTDVAASEQAYIGTFTFRVSQDAIGAFSVRALSEYVALFSEFEAPVINPIKDTIVLVTGATRGR